MTDPFIETIANVLEKTNSELNVFFILMILAAFIVLIPIYRMKSKQKENLMAHEKEMESERSEREAVRVQQVINVVSANTEAMNKLNACIGTLAASSENAHQRMQDTLNDIAFHVKSRPCATGRAEAPNSL